MNQISKSIPKWRLEKEAHDWWDTLYENDVAFYKKYKTLEHQGSRE